jgi:hypothetical protein
LKNVKNQGVHFNDSEMGPRRSDRKKLFSKTSQSAPSHSSNLPPRRNVDLQAMRLMGFGVADYSQRSTQHKRNAEFFVSRCVGMEVDKFYATPKSLADNFYHFVKDGKTGFKYKTIAVGFKKEGGPSRRLFSYD